MAHSGGAPLKPWEVARLRQNQDSTEEQKTNESNTEGYRNPTQTFNQTNPYTPYTSTPYSSYPTNGYGNGGFYGYPSSYGTGMYGNYGNYGNYGSYNGYHGGMYGYNSSPWTRRSQIPGSMPFQYDAPKTPFWQRLLEGLQKIVNCFGRVTFLVDENTQAFHFFITALLTFLDKAGSLYGEIARFVMKLLGLRRRSKSSVPEVSRVASGRTNNPSELFKKIWKE